MPLRDVIALSPKSTLFERDIAVRFQDADRDEIVRSSASELIQAFGTMNVLFFELRLSHGDTVAEVVRFDYFPIAAIYVRWLTELVETDSDMAACVSLLGGLLLRIASDLSRPKEDVKREVVAALILSIALENVAEGLPALSGTKFDTVRGDAMYSDLVGHTSLLAIAAAIRRQFAD